MGGGIRCGRGLYGSTAFLVLTLGIGIFEITWVFFSAIVQYEFLTPFVVNSNHVSFRVCFSIHLKLTYEDRAFSPAHEASGHVHIGPSALLS